MVYLDNASTTKINDSVFDAMVPFLRENYGNPGGLYSIGLYAKNAIEKSREKVAFFLGCSPENVIFTSGGSEGNNMVISGLSYYMKLINKMNFITSSMEHDSILKSISLQCMLNGFTCTIVKPTSNGIITTDILKDTFEKYGNITGITSIMYTNNELGTINDVEKISSICKEYGILFHTDCTQSAGFIDLNMNDIGCDFATISAHKFHGPKGAGALYVKDCKIIKPIISGGSSQEFGMRGGTENVAAIVGMGVACEIAKNDIDKNRKNIISLRRLFIEYIKSKIENVIINCDNEESKIISLTIPGVDAQTLVIMLGDRVAISAGSACCSHESTPSHVLLSIGISEHLARETIRVSLSDDNTRDDIINGVNEISNVINTIKSL